MGYFDLGLGRRLPREYIYPMSKGAVIDSFIHFLARVVKVAF